MSGKKAESKNRTPKKKEHKFRREFDKKICDKLIVNEPDVMIVYQDGNIKCDIGYESKKKIQIMSMTKTIVAYLFTMEFMKNSEMEDEEIDLGHTKTTLGELLNHTSGLVERKTMNEMYKSKNWFEFARANSYFDKKQRGKFKYSNFGYILLGDIYRIVTGIKISDTFEKIFQWNKDKYGNCDTAGGLMIEPTKLLDLALIMNGMISKYNEEHIKEHYGKKAGEILNKLKENKQIAEKMIKKNYGIKKVSGDFYEFQDGFLGQYLVFNRKKELVALRLKAKKKGSPESHDDPDFVKKVVDNFKK